MIRTITRDEAGRIPAELFQQHMAELYWLAFLITGDQDQSIEAFTDAVEFDEPAPTSLGSLLSWARKLVMVAALDAVRSQVRDSKERAQRAAKNGDPSHGLMAAAVRRVQHLTTSDLEQALLAIDVFPRCALLLTFFEGLPIDDTSILLDADRELVRTAQVEAAIELTRHLTNRSGETTQGEPIL
jgi:DNA-directed RNA polymerase specialized sigma24 family protein